MNILGITGPIHDTSTAILVDGRVVAAAEEERFTRDKHAYRTAPSQSLRYCLQTAGLEPRDVDVIAYPWSLHEFRRNSRRHLVRSSTRGVVHALNSYVKTGRRFSKYENRIKSMLRREGFDLDRVQWMHVPHHVAHGSSSFHLSGFDEAAVMTVDALGEYITSQFAHGHGKDIDVIWNDYMPDSFGCFYTSMTEWLGFRSNDGEYKVMGMAPYGDPSKVDLSGIAWVDDSGFHVNPEYVWVSRHDSYQGKLFSKKLVDRLGPPRTGDALSEPYIHVAAAVQDLLVRGVIALMERHLSGVLEKTGRLAFAGGCALNVALNRHLIKHPLVKELWVCPAANDAGTSLGAATYAARQLGEDVEPLTSSYLGPDYRDDEIEEALGRCRIPWEKCDDIEATCARLLADGHMLGWMQGRMEFGPRALGNRSILGNPSIPEMADIINERIKFREKWRPFCPSVLESAASDFLMTDHPSPFMTFSFDINPEWKDRVPECIHVDGTGRPQVVHEDINPRYHRLLTEFEKITGLPVLINTSLNRRGEPMVCSPDDALKTFYGCGLEYMAIGDYLIRKPH